MIRQISFEHYKAFNFGKIKIKPITILLGANSVGKSSIINLISMLQQTANCTNYKSALRLHGENVSLGEPENIFRNKDLSKDLKIEFYVENEKLNDLLSNYLINDIENLANEPLRFFPSSVMRKLFKENNVHLHDHRLLRLNEPRKYPFADIISYYFTYLKDKDSHKKVFNDELLDYYLERNPILTSGGKERVLKIYSFLKALQKNVTSSNFFIAFECSCLNRGQKDDVIKIKRFTISTHSHKKILDILFSINSKFSDYDSIEINSDFNILNEIINSDDKSQILHHIIFNSTIFSWLDDDGFTNRDFFSFADEKNHSSLLGSYILRIISEAISSLREQFSSGFINHVSPLRANPKRYYFLDKSNITTSLDSLDGDSLAEILKENDIIRNKVNSWFQTFGFSIDVLTLQDIIHKLRVHQYSLDLDITDVGFGISQILPIIVQGFLSFNNSLTMVEQPEIHLHPKMQAELADLFIDMAEGFSVNIRKSFKPKTSFKGNNKKYFLIETHSEYFLKRMIRRISEGLISSDDVAIYFIEPPVEGEENSASEIIEKEISNTGILDWPTDFYEGELQKDNLNYVKQLFSSKK